MKYKKAQVDVIDFSGTEFFLISSGELSAIASQIKPCADFGSINSENGSFSCSNFPGDDGNGTFSYGTLYWFSQVMGYDENGEVKIEGHWTCTVFG